MATEIVDPAFGGAARSVLTDSLWAVLREALQPIAGTFGITLPLEILQPPAGWVPLDQLVANKLTEFFVYLFGQGNALYQSTIQPIVNTIVNGITNIVPTADKLITWIQQAFASLTIDTQQVTDAIITVIRSSLSNALNTAFSNLSNAAASITDPLIAYLKDIQDSTISIYNWTLNTFQREYTALVNLATNASTWAEQSVRDLRTYVEPQLNTIITLLQGNTTGIIQTVTQQIQTQLTAFIGQANSIVGNLAPTIITTLQSFITQATNQVTDIAQGLLQGSQTAVQYAVNQLSELEGYISTEFKFWVGEEGEYIINSLRGPQQGLAHVEQVVQAISGQVQDGFNFVVQTDQTFYADLATRIDNGFLSMSTGISQQVQAGLGDIWGGFKTTILDPIGRDINNFFLNAWDRLKSFFTPVGCELQQVEDFFGGIFNTISTWIQSLCGADCHNMDKNPFNIISRSLSSVLGVGGGMGLSMLAGELIMPLKHLGLSRLSAYFWDLADFKSVGGDVLKTLNVASTVKPLQYGLNEFFRPEIPRTDEANTWFHKGIIGKDDWHKIYAQHGLSDDYIINYAKDIYTEPSDRVVLNLLDTQGVPIEWVNEKLAARGYSPADIVFLKLYANNRRLSDEFNSAKTAYEAAYVKGYISADDYGVLLRTIGRSDQEIAWAILAAEQKARTARLTEDIDILVNAFRTGKLSLDAFTQNINGLGLDADRTANIIDKEVARQKLHVAVEKAVTTKKLSVTQVFQALDLSLISTADAKAHLVDLNYTEADADILIAIHAAGQAVTGP